MELLEERSMLSGGVVLTHVGLPEPVPPIEGDDTGSCGAYAACLDPRDPLVSSDDGLLVAGLSQGGGDRNWLLLRYNLDGTLDTTFGTGGATTTDFNPGYIFWSGDGYARAITTLSDGRIVTGGWAMSPLKSKGGTTWQSDFALACYNPDGSLDTTFGGQKPDLPGTVRTHVSNHVVMYYEQVFALFAQADDKVLAVGSTKVDNSARIALARYTDAGRLDSGFGNGGIVVSLLNGTTSCEAFAATIQQVAGQDKLVVAGRAYVDASAHPFVARYNLDGTLDTTFGASGVVVLPDGGCDTSAVSCDTGGNVFASFPSSDYYHTDFVVYKLKSDGTPDPSGFGSEGRASINAGRGVSVYDLAIQPDGAIVVSGQGAVVVDDPLPENPNHKKVVSLNNWALARFTADGLPDTTFGTAGVEIDADLATKAGAHSVMFLDGKIEAIGTVNGHVAVLRYESNGTPDDTFGRPTIAISSPDGTYAMGQAEGNSGTTDCVFTVRLSRPADSDITFQYAVAGGTATAGIDYVVDSGTSGTLTIQAGHTSVPITVKIVGDTVVEGNEYFYVNIFNATNSDPDHPGDVAIGCRQATRFIDNDDTKKGSKTTSAATVSVAALSASLADASLTLVDTDPAPAKKVKDTVEPATSVVLTDGAAATVSAPSAHGNQRVIDRSLAELSAEGLPSNRLADELIVLLV